MKFSKYFMMAGAAALLAACSSEEPLVEGPQGYPMPAEIAENDSYALIGLQLAPQSGTRAEPADAGLATEYQVANGQILLFDADNNKFVARQPLAMNWQDETQHADLNRQTYVRVGFPKGTFEAGKSYKACIVLNYPADYVWPKKTEDETDTFETWNVARNTTFTYTVSGSTYMTMVSAPSYVNATTATNGLVTLTGTPVTDLDKLTTSNVMATFYVHRVPAKITLTADGNANTKKDHVYSITTGAYTGATVTVTGWDRDVVASQAYPIQNVAGLNFTKARTHSTVDENQTTGFTSFARCNWAKGAFYDTEYASTDYERTNSITSFPTVKYVKENTMTAKNQIEKRTTRVVVKASFQLKDVTAGTDLIRVLSVGNETGASVSTLRTKEAFVSLAETKAGISWKSGAKMVVKKTAAGTYALKDFCTFEVGEGETKQELKWSDTDNTVKNTFNEIAVALGLSNAETKELSLYAGGECYYAIPIRHFADDEFDNDEKLPDTFATANDYDDVKHLGRYGILRNNWYDITVSGITKIGEPVIPTPGDDPVDKPKDEVDGINFNIYMLNWSKRSQSETL